MRSTRHLLISTFILASANAVADPAKFDGAWRATMTCPPHNDPAEDVKGYTHQLVGQVKNGQMTITHGNEGEPGWHILKGKIQEDGSANLLLEGVVNNTKYAINEAPKGKVYSYRVKAQFDEAKGSGKRLSGRVCEFQFSR